MCGICGYMAFHEEEGERILERMTDTLEHRGPDDSGQWVDADVGVGLGHRRLSILDLSPLGRQPMESACGRFVIVFNGEIYNHLRLREELVGYPFRSHSDTETILAAVNQWGVKKAVHKLVGMFSIALWDKAKRRLHLIRDRMGIKPLYYGWCGKHFVFGSELKALRLFPGFDGDIDRDALTLYFRHNYIPAPWTVYSQARKLEPGRILTLCMGDSEPVVEQYWSALEAWNHGSINPYQGTFEDGVDELDAILTDSVGIRLLSDVPLGGLLSGGVDSSMVVALMQKVSGNRVKTFSIGFHEDEFNEAPHAKAVADYLGTDHTELYMTPQDMLNVIPPYSPGIGMNPFPILRRYRLTAFSIDAGPCNRGPYR